VAKPDANDILRKATGTAPDSASYRAYYGGGHAAEKIAGILAEDLTF